MKYLKQPVCNCGSIEVTTTGPDEYLDQCADCGRILEGQIEKSNVVPECDYCSNILETKLEHKQGLCTSCYVRQVS